MAPGLRIVYLLPAGDAPVGGNKVSYRQIDILTSLGVDAYAFHPEKPGMSYTWFPHGVRSLKHSHFDPRRDFVVIPEIWASLGARFCTPAGLRHALWVQNGYLAHLSAGFGERTAERAYRHADLVLSISKDTTRVLTMLYPFIPADGIHRMRGSVSKLFAPGTKERLITYMPRKLPTHSELVSLYLRNALTGGWRLLAIENLSEAEVAALLAKSSIFLSFSHLEGYGLPPVEAALAGNLVVGYTGQGGREYFEPPILRAVEPGDFPAYVDQVCAAIMDVERGLTDSPNVRAQRQRLAQMHSVENEIADVAAFAARVRTAMGPAAV